jgi:CubicO group peptidase (beta-lactamase class C family)
MTMDGAHMYRNKRDPALEPGAGRRVSRRQVFQHGGVGLAGGVLAAAGLAPHVAAQDATPVATPVPPVEGITPDGVATALDALDGIVKDLIAKTGVPGVSLAVVYADETRATRGYGVASTETGAAVDADTIFQLASLSKPLASTVVASIVGDELVTWDTPIVAHLPSFALAEPWVTSQVTIRDMFCHRSGLPDHAGDMLEDMGYDRNEVLHRLRYQEPASSFRSTYNYTNFGLTAGAVAASTATGQAWEDACRDRLYTPAGMTRTSSRFEDFANAENRAHGHVPVDGAWQPRYVRNPDAQSPAGGVSSTAMDMAQWMRLQLGNGTLDGIAIIPAAALAETHRPQIVKSLPGEPASFYGLGWNAIVAGGNQVNHSGAFSLGAGTTVFLLLDDGLGIVVLTNGQAIGLAEAIVLSFLEVARTGVVEIDYLAALTPIFAEETKPQYGQDVDYTTPPADPLPPQQFDRYIGRYANDFCGVVEIAADGDGLTLSQGPEADPDVYPLTHWSRDTFVYLPLGENANYPAAVTCAIGPDGMASSVWVENLDIHGQGTFRREAKAS